VKAGGWTIPLRFLWLVCVLCFAGIGCSSPERLGNAGDQCLQVTDCSLGLACVPKGDGTSVCSADLSKIVNVEDAAAAADGGSPPDAGQPDTAPADDGAGQEAASDDGSAVEASLPPLEAGPDSTMPPEAGPPDAAHPPDAAKPRPEAGAPDGGPADSAGSMGDALLASDSSAD
jgi:hypothetical protein